MANLQVRVDDDLKAKADSLFASIGLDTSSAVRGIGQSGLACSRHHFSNFRLA